MDPQQKLALEVTFRAFENAGLTEDKTKGSKTAVYIGQMNYDFAKNRSMDVSVIDNYTATGTSSSILANRISYAFDLRGPSVTLDTACSSSLVGVHLGAKSIVTGESEMAVCGGVNLMLSPGTSIALSKARMASKLGQCQPFSAEADGYTRGEGCGFVILKSVKKALADKDRIWGYISTGCNSNGRSASPITTPSSKSQQSLIIQTFKEANMPQHSVQYVEMHGTGTPVGDPAEALAVGETIGRARQLMQYTPVKIGSVKSNIGHLESAAGVAGLIKVLLMMHYGQYTSSLFSSNLNPAINFHHLCLEVVRQSQDWPLIKKERVAALNSFGFGGTNIHAIVKYAYMNETIVPQNMPLLIVAFSGKTKKSVMESMKDTLDGLHKGYIKHIYDTAYTSFNLRNHYLFRKAVLIQPSMENFIEQLENLVKYNEPAITKLKTSSKTNTIFVFCGMGTHWDKMGKEFYETVPIFKETIDTIDKQFYQLSGFKIQECLFGHKDLNNPAYGQPAIFGVQVGLVEMWRYFGVMPDFVLGHSVGEVAAAYASNSLCLKSAVKVIFHRSRLLMNMQGGSMLVVGNVLVSEVERYIDEFGFQNDLCIAAYNTPKECTVSGKSEVISKLEDILKIKLTDTNVFLRKLPVKFAYHSHYMDPVSNQIRRNLVNLLPGMDPIKHISTVTGELTEQKTFCAGDYWARNARDSVLFDKAFRKTLDNHSQNIVIEIGPKPALRRYINQISNCHNCRCKVLASMTEDKCNDMFFKELGQFYESGGQILFKNPGNVETYPKYGFDQTCLFAKTPKAHSFLYDVNAIDSINHPFIAKHVTHISEDMVTVANITKDTVPFVYDHIVDGITIIPGAAYVEMAATSVLMQRPDTYILGKHLVVKIHFKQPCIVTNIQNINTTLFFEGNTNPEQFEFDCTTPDTLHASGVVVLQDNRMYNAKQYNIASIKSRCKDMFKASDLYCQLKKLKFVHGPLLQSVKCGQQNNLEIFADVEIDDEKYENYLLHPVLLDCLLQLCCMFPAASQLIGQVIPFGIEEVIIERKLPRIIHVYLHLRKSSDTMFLIDADAMDKAGNTVLQCKGIKMGVIGSELNTNIQETMFNLFWMDVTVEKSKNPGEGKIFTLSCLDSTSLKGIHSTGLAKNMHVIENDPFDGTITKTLSSNNMKQFTHVMFILGKSYISESSTGEFVSETIARICFSLLELVRFIIFTHPHISVTVLTTHVYNNLENMENTMHTNDENLDGLVGYSVWGMLRTIRHEFPFQKIKVIDIDNYDTNCWHTVQNILTQNMAYNEIAVTAQGIKTCHFSYVPAVNEKKRLINIEEECGVTMHYGNVSCGEYHDLMFQPIGNIDCSENKTLINARKLFLLHPGRINSPGKSSSEQLMSSVGGTVIHNAKRFHLIQLIPVKSKLHVHPDVLLPFDVFPFDNPPLASIWFLAWLLCNLLNRSQARIMSTNKKDVWHNTFKQMMKIMEMYTDEVDVNALIIIANNTVDLEFLLDEYRGKSLQSILILTWNIELKLKMHHYLDDQNINFSVEVFTVEELLTESDALYKNVKLFCMWLRKIDKKTIESRTDIICNTQDLSVYHLHNLNVDSKIQGDSVLIIEKKQNVPITIGKKSIYQKRGTYLIFGGSKGLGWELAKHMAKHGAGRIGVISRNGISEKALEACELMTTYDCDIIDIKADAICETDVQDILKDFKNDLLDKPLRGVFVGTVALNDALIKNMTLEKFEYVLQPKVAAVWNIHQSVGDLNLDFFVTQSSITSMFGNAGQTNYGAANAFLDAFSCYRRRKYGNGQSICWGALDVGWVLELVNDPVKKKIIANLGLLPINKVQILETWDDCLMHNHKMICYAKFNWVQFFKKTSGHRNLTETIQPLLKRKCHHIQYNAQDMHFKMKQDVDNTTEYVFKLLSDVLMLDDDEIYMAQSLASLGADSHQTSIIHSSLLANYGNIPTLSEIALPTMNIKALCNLVGANLVDDDDSLNKDSHHNKSTEEGALVSKTNEHVLNSELEVKMKETEGNHIESHSKNS